MEDYIYLDGFPLLEHKYLVTIIDRTDNTISVVGTNDRHGLAYRGVRDIEDNYVGTTYLVSDSEGNECEVIRLR